jgi:hypothetical protein
VELLPEKVDDVEIVVHHRYQVTGLFPGKCHPSLGAQTMFESILKLFLREPYSESEHVRPMGVIVNPRSKSGDCDLVQLGEAGRRSENLSR